MSYEAAVSYTYGGATLALNGYNLASTRNFAGAYSSGLLYVLPHAASASNLATNGSRLRTYAPVAGLAPLARLSRRAIHRQP